MFDDKNPRYNSPEDAHQRLHDTFMMYNGVPSYIQGMRGFEFNVYDLGDPQVIVKSVNVKCLGYDELNANFPLGFVNVIDEERKRADAYYLVRNPRRQTREGIARNNTDAAMISDFPMRNFITSQRMWPAINRMARGEYPSVYEAMKILAKYGPSSCYAFDRHFALLLVMTEDEPQVNLYWKTSMIGFVYVNSDLPKGRPIPATLLPLYLKNTFIVDGLRQHNFII